MKFPPDFSDRNKAICEKVMPYTMTSIERVNALIDAVIYLINNHIDGAFVECGVWKGGSVMTIALALKSMGDESRDLYLYDTFSGMSAPGDFDISYRGEKAHGEYIDSKISEDVSKWCLSSMDEVKKNIFSTGYPKEKIHFIQGKVEDTLPIHAPGGIALLRLDTDWYDSTKHEMIHLYPLLNKRGVLIIDDYGHWKGAKKAVDEYISENNIRIFLNRVDYTGRIAIKDSF